ncbi:MAG: tetratricopeptide repeat protein [Lachnospiraceae bacterium]
MKCNKCGATLTETDFCNNCGTNVRIYKKLLSTSNALYNRGLEKAKVRDLSGAKEDLKNSLKVYKKNTPARNLLGLVYYEMGDVVSALSEWIISKNYEPEDNIADNFIVRVQENSSKLDACNMSLKKYNQSLLYARQGSLDLAVIQLKKVLSSNPNLVDAHLLLALIYLHQEQIDQARKEVKKVLAIDKGNVQAMAYLNETEGQKGKESKSKNNRISRDAVAYTSGNETIIQPKNMNENSGKKVFLDIIVGFLIGMAVCWFVFAPARMRSASSDANKQVIEYSDQLDAKNAAIDAMNEEVKAANAAKEEAEQKAKDAGDTITSYESLYAAQEFAAAQDYESAAAELAKVREELLTDAAKENYQNISTSINAKAIQSLYSEGAAYYNARNYEKGAESLEKVVELDPQNADATYYLARCYDGMGDLEKAKKYYEKVVELLPETTQRAQTAMNFLNNHP